MKKNIFICLGAVCSVLFYSCQKNMDTDLDNANPAAAGETSLVNESAFFDPTGLVAHNAELVKLAEGFGFTEGPAVDKHGNVFFTDQPNDKIYRWDANTGAVTTFLSNTGRSNGMFFDKDGNLITCADMHGEVWSIDKHGNHTVLVNNYNGKLLNGPNDLWINPCNGGIYITDPMFPRDYWDDNDPRKGPWPGNTQQGGGFVYYLSPNRHTFTRVVTEDMGWPNGIVGSNDGKKLYVGKWPSDVYVFDINPNGTLSNKKLFVSGPGTGGDGMATDERGNIYMTNEQGVTAYDKKGNKVLNIPTGQGWTANLVFGRPNEKLLFITSLDKIYGLKMRVKGVEKF